MSQSTPMMVQYNSIKNRHKDALLFFRMGDFYELFNEDAKVASRVLGITLTSRSKNENAVPMAGVPHHAADSYISRLIKEGFKVAICEQIQDVSEAKGLVERDVIRIVTPGTVTEDSLLDDRSNNFLASILIKDNRAGLSWVDISTGRFDVEDIDVNQLKDELARINPSECLMPEDWNQSGFSLDTLFTDNAAVMMTARPGWEFACDTGHKMLTEHFETSSLTGFGCEDLELSLGSAGAILLYLKETQKASLSHIRKINKFSRKDYLILDQPTQYSLELVETMRTKEKARSLLGVLDQTHTPMGGRLLREWTMTPLKDVSAIKIRQQGIKELFENIGLRMELQKILKDVYDIERISTKISCGRANPRDMVSLKQSLSLLPNLKEALAECKSGMIKTLYNDLDIVEDVRVLIGTTLVTAPPLNIKEGGIIREGYSNDLDDLRNTSKNGKGWIANFQADEIKRTGVQTLKVGYNRVFGYYIEVTNMNKDKIPLEYIRKQTLKNAERYITTELKEYESKVLTADERAKGIELDIFQKLKEEVAGFTHRIQKSSDVIAQLDTICSLANVAAENGYIMPEIDDGLELTIIDGKHPVLDKEIQGEEFVPNDTHIDGRSDYVMIITGPNMAGKSTYIRQVALIVILAQIGSFIPARKAKIGVVDRIFTRIGAADELAKGQSTFMVEMNEVANILNNASQRSLLILDEVGRGTSTYDGVSIAWAVVEHIFERLKARTLFATHYHELTALSKLFPGIKNYNIAVKELKDNIVFLRKIVEGGTDKSYGIHVARLAGIPEKVIKRSQTIHSKLGVDAGTGIIESAGNDETINNKHDMQDREDKKEGKKGTAKQLSLFDTQAFELVETIRNIDVSNITPLEALNKLNEIKDNLA
ncbi:MAG: DNA mismatch repair protein MutS [Candidatus Anammoxibacter sp.]